MTSSFPYNCFNTAKITLDYMVYVVMKWQKHARIYNLASCTCLKPSAWIPYGAPYYRTVGSQCATVCSLHFLERFSPRSNAQPLYGIRLIMPSMASYTDVDAFYYGAF